MVSWAIIFCTNQYLQSNTQNSQYPLKTSQINLNDSDYVSWLDEVWNRKLSTKFRDGVQLSVGILLWPTFPLMSLTGIVESLRHAGDQGDDSQQRYIRWEIIGTPDSMIESSCGIKVSTTCNYVNPSEFDYIFIIGGLMKDLSQAPKKHIQYLHMSHPIVDKVVAVCTGSFILAKETLLNNTPAAVHPYHIPEFELTYPGHKTVRNVDFHSENKIITVPGGISILSLMTEIIEQHLGSDRGAKIVHQLSLPGKRGLGKLESMGINRHVEISDPRIQKALVLMEYNSGHEITIKMLSKKLDLSERHFSRLFKNAVGKSPKEYMIESKLKAAIWMLRNTIDPITSIAYSTGFSSGAAFAELCRRHLGRTPSEIRLKGIL